MDIAVGFSVIKPQSVLKRVSYQIQSNKESMLSNEAHFNGIKLMESLSVNPAKSKMRKNQIKNSVNPSIHFSNCTPINQQSFQTQVQKTPNSHIQSQQTYLNFTQGHENRERKTFTSDFNSKQIHLSPNHNNETQQLKNSLSHLKGQLEKCKLENQRHRCQKVEYEEAVYEMKIRNEALVQQVKELNEQAALIKREQEVRRSRKSLVSQVLSYKHSQQFPYKTTYESQIQRQKAAESNSLEYIPNIEEVKNSNPNTADLEVILSEMKQKLSQYEKKLAQKETLNNHQHYLLEKIKNQQNQLNTNQASLLQELEYVLAKNKKLKKENQQIKVENEEIKKDNDQRVAQVIQLQELNAQLEMDIKELFWKVNQLEREKLQIEEKFHDITADTKEPYSSTHLSLKHSEELLPSSLTQNLQQICKVLDQRQKAMLLAISPCLNIEILPNCKEEQIQFGDTRFSKSIQLGDVDINYQIESRNALILRLEEQLQAIRKVEDQMEQDLQKTKLKLCKLKKDIQALEIQHQAMKNVFEEEKAHLQQEIQQKEHLLMVSLSLIEDLKIRQMSSKSITSIEDY